MKKIKGYSDFIVESTDNELFVDDVIAMFKREKVTGEFTCSPRQKKNGNCYLQPSLEEIRSSIERQGLQNIVLRNSYNLPSEEVLIKKHYNLIFQFSQGKIKEMLNASSRTHPSSTIENSIEIMRECIDKWVYSNIEEKCDLNNNEFIYIKFFKSVPLSKYEELYKYNGVKEFCKNAPIIAEYFFPLILSVIYYSTLHNKIDNFLIESRIDNVPTINFQEGTKEREIYLHRDPKIIDKALYIRLSAYIVGSTIRKLSAFEGRIPSEMYDFLVKADKEKYDYKSLMEELHRKRGIISTRNFGI